jgi:hypothetical protein
MKKLFFIMPIALLILSCKKDSMNENTDHSSNFKNEITHNYSYKGDTYSVNYTFDRENRLIKCSGDTIKHKKSIQNGIASNELSLLIEGVNKDNSIFDIRVFDNQKTLDTYCEVTENDQELFEPCTNFTYRNGSSKIYRFYEHPNYVSEYSHLFRSCTSFQQQWLGSANDQISSLSISGGFLDLYGGSCYSGMRIRTYHNISNLHTVYVGWWWGNIYAGDWCSSIKGR